MGAALVCAALATLPAAALGSARHASSNSQSYPDSIGEDPNAPDITSIDVSNDDAGLITFKVNISNRPTFTQDMEFILLLDTKPGGDPQNLGATYGIVLDPGQVTLFQWNGSDYVVAPSQTSLVYSYNSTGPTVQIDAHDLGSPRQIQFAVIARSGVATDASGNPDYTNAHEDDAPDPGHGTYTYQVLTKLILKQTAFSTSPSPARAGKRFSASLGASENDTNGPVTRATITCAATAGGRRLPATHSLANGVASCYWKLPRTAKGKLLHGTVTVTVQGTKLVKSFAVRIR